MKQSLFTAIDEMHDELIEMADYICDNPEVGLQECKASSLLVNRLKKEGFQTELGVGSLPTAFRAEWSNGTGGPSIGLLCEYDALEEIGHGCGHHLQGPAVIGAAISLKRILRSDTPCSIVVYGTPAEETVGGKVIMMNHGCMQDIDVALMMHASGSGTGVDDNTLALTEYELCYHGMSSHAAIRPEDGRSALDALLLALHGIEILREHVPDDVRIHYAISSGGMPANVVPDYAAARIVARSYIREELESVVRRLEKIFEGAAMMTETTCEARRINNLDNSICVRTLQELLMNNAHIVGAPKISPPRKKTGSTDFGNVCHRIPGACIRVSSDGENPPPGHSREAALQGKSDENHAAVIYAAKILAATVYDIVENSMVMEAIKADFITEKERKN